MSEELKAKGDSCGDENNWPNGVAIGTHPGNTCQGTRSNGDVVGELSSKYPRKSFIRRAIACLKN